jgi:hypothetical protein
VSNYDSKAPKGSKRNPILVQCGEIREIGPGEYCEVLSGGKVIVHLGGFAKVEDGGEATIRKGGRAAVLEYGFAKVEDGGEVEVFDGGFATVRKGGKAMVRKGGIAKVEDGGEAMVCDGGEAMVLEGGRAEVFEGGFARVEDGGFATVHGGKVEVYEGGNADILEGLAKVYDGGKATVHGGGVVYATRGAKVKNQGGRIDDKWDGFSPMPGFDDSLPKSDNAPGRALVIGTDAPATEDEQSGQSSITAKDGRTPDEREIAIHYELIRLYKKGEEPTIASVAAAKGTTVSAVRRSDAWNNRTITKRATQVQSGPTAKKSGMDVNLIQRSTLETEFPGVDLDPLKDEMASRGVDLGQLMTDLDEIDLELKTAAMDTVKEFLKSDPHKAATALIEAAQIAD